MLPSLPAGAQSAEEHAGKPIQRGIASPAAAPAGSRVDLDTGRVIVTLSGVIGLILLLRWGARKLFPGAIVVSRNQAVKVLARCPLAPRQQVILLQVGRRIVVAAESGSQVSSLCQITDADEVASLLGELQRDKAAPAVSTFTSWFARSAQAFAEEDDMTEPAEPAELPPGGEIEGIGLGSLTDKVRQITRELRGRRPTP
jgi:flagellar biogenesis protein FliO